MCPKLEKCKVLDTFLKYSYTLFKRKREHTDDETSVPDERLPTNLHGSVGSGRLREDLGTEGVKDPVSIGEANDQ